MLRRGDRGHGDDDDYVPLPEHVGGPVRAGARLWVRPEPLRARTAARDAGKPAAVGAPLPAQAAARQQQRPPVFRTQRDIAVLNPAEGVEGVGA